MEQPVTLKNGMPFTVAKARAADAADVLSFLRRVGGESENLLFSTEAFATMTAEQEADYLETQAQSEASVTLCGRAGGEVAAIASLATPTIERIAHTSELSIVVSKALWGQGAGSAMMQSLLEFARDTGKIEMLHLGVRAANHGAIHLYEKFGFSKAGVFRHFFNINGVYDDEVLMTLHLRG